MKNRRGGFTLVEMLVVIGILLILFSLTVAGYKALTNGDKIRAASRQLQSVILGARDRAIHAKEKRGVRLILDPSDMTTVTSVQYIAPVANWTGNVRLGRPNLDGSAEFDPGNPMTNDGADDDADQTVDVGEDVVRTVRGGGTGWLALARRGLLIDGSRIKLSGSWYTVSLTRMRGANGALESVGAGASDDMDDILTLTTDFRTASSPPNTPPVYTDTFAWPYIAAFPITAAELELQPAILAGEQPIALGSGIVIDLDNSRIPTGWLSGGAYVKNMDIMFSPRGTITGPLAAQGIVHLLLAELRDTALNFPPETSLGDKKLVTLFTRTGAVSTHEVDTFAGLGPDLLPGVAGTDDDGNGTTDYTDEDGDGIFDVGEPLDLLELGYAGSDDVLRDRYRFAETGLAAGK